MNLELEPARRQQWQCELPLVGAAGPGTDVGDNFLSSIDRPAGRGSSFRFLCARQQAARRAATDGDGRMGAFCQDAS